MSKQHYQSGTSSALSRSAMARKAGLSDPSLRRQVYGKIQPMEQPGLFARLFGLRH